MGLSRRSFLGVPLLWPGLRRARAEAARTTLAARVQQAQWKKEWAALVEGWAGIELGGAVRWDAVVGVRVLWLGW